MSASEALYALLSADSGVTGEVGARVFPVVIPQGETLPALAYLALGGRPVGLVAAAPTLGETTFAVIAVAEHATPAREAAAAVYQATRRASGVYGGTTVLSTRATLPRDGFDPEAALYTSQVDVTMTHTV